jgi:hypothetical protein
MRLTSILDNLFFYLSALLWGVFDIISIFFTITTAFIAGLPIRDVFDAY